MKGLMKNSLFKSILVGIVLGAIGGLFGMTTYVYFLLGFIFAVGLVKFFKIRGKL